MMKAGLSNKRKNEVYMQYKAYSQKIQPRQEIECGYCWDSKKKKTKELFFLDRANNMRICIYCPSCGRKLQED